ncbi:MULTISPECIES: preprotein translocase subunit SecA [Segatella]|jgi:preprotein translocase subunit SecA|uniref:Protein translocase subunit SecA n=2 Tax=Segatella TaxID=2974251 RepID=D8DT73_9BACT|nr:MULTISPECIES: preprotein translocase subunit SecA [Segatella]MBQ3857252.1 preprotein translocase subunit SecA [Prevotella sp.]EFI73388.1 preprotein translocase, SecA subunit [Segatella baroniae B14]MDR4929703.1 preprotein translocase subunit SecA [Segatella bryantii]MEE3414998.1 preprotein translocase subunit SecA [Prevotella sp.]UKK75782.1 preprotein translocase subunit SecA [Segatella bryantii]
MNFNKFLVSLFGNKSSRDMKTIQPIVEKVKAAYADIQKLSNDELRAKTKEIQKYVQDAGKEQRDQIAELRAKIEDTPIDEREVIFNQIDKLHEEELQKYEDALNEVLPVAFSIVKDTARRFTENEETVVTATDFDRELASDPAKDFVTIDGDKAIYHNTWTAGGNKIKWEMVHYDVQLFGGVVLHQGKIAEMATGEGKTLVATTAVFLNALTGNGVHMVTVNDYLAKRDSEWMGPLYEFNGLSVDCIDKHRPNSPERRKAYQADITFGTNNEFGFDYLRDNMAISPDDLVQREHNYAIVDEVDSVLIDDARTPLIISGPVPKGDVQMFEEYQPLVERLYEVQRKQATELLAEAKQKIAEGAKNNNQKLLEEGFLSLYRSYKALPKNKPLIKYLSEEGIKAGMLKTEEYYMANNNREMPKAIEPLYFVVDEKMNSADLTDKGTEWLAKQVNDKELFVLPDITSELSDLEANKTLSDQERLDKKDDLLNHYAIQSERVHTLQQLLKAYTMFTNNDEYVVMDGEIKIVDEQTGRIMEGRRWSDGLHQAIEAKEHVKVEAATQTFASITLQNYFRMYHKLSGMTGTASTEAGEFWDIYKLDVVEIPTNRPILRHDLDDRVYKTQREKYKAVIDEVELMRNAGRPVLVGTTSVEISELLSKMLKMRNIPHNVLNAKLHQKEAQIVAEAGRCINGKGVVTIATNMAGRGTDIKLTPEVKAAGGLAIIGTERHESRRVDRQLRGRAGRQGDPGSSVFYVSLEDKLMRLFASDRIAKVMDRLGFEDGERIESPMISKSIERAQKKVEENNFGIRKHLLEYDDVMNKQRTIIYEKRRHALMGERIGMDITNVIWDRVLNIVTNNDFIGAKEEFYKVLSMEIPFDQNEFENTSKNDLCERAFQAAMADFKRKTDRIQSVAWPIIKQVYENQGQLYERIMVPITDGKRMYQIPCHLKTAYDTEAKSVVKQFEKVIMLHIIDEEWKDNLRKLDELRHSVQNASYEQKDPLLIFKLESVKVWDAMIDEMNTRIATILMRGQIPEMQPADQVQEATPEEHSQRYNEQKVNIEEEQERLNREAQQAAMSQDTREGANEINHTPYRAEKTPRPNDLCPCGSGKKFKNCHGSNIAE